MKPVVRFFTFLTLNLLFVYSSQSYQILDPVNRPLLSFLVGPARVPACLINCTTELKESLMEFVYGDITINSREEICEVYDQSMSCVRDSRECEEYQVVYRKLTSGFNWACDSTSNNPFESLFPCIVKMGKEARDNWNCAEHCNIPNGSNHLFHDSPDGLPPKNAIGNLEPFCGPFACYLNCTRKQMNKYCPTSGSKLIHVPASALDELVDEFQRTTKSEKREIFAQVPKSCQLFFKESEVTSFRFDEEFVYDLFFMITSRKQRTKNGGAASSQARQIVDELISKMEGEEKQPALLKWDAKSISTATAMAIVILINLIGLGFTVYWCLYSDENNDNGHNNALGGVQFVEPNIRMKLKLPRMSAVIKDSSQEVLELRVPRNGNQLNADAEQHTVVVPRWKRRRTFSVPLDPRSRTNSTGSDQFPNIVVLRTHET